MTRTDQQIAAVLTAFNDPDVRKAAATMSAAFARMDDTTSKAISAVERLQRERTLGRVPSQDVFADSPGYTPGISAAANTGGHHEAQVDQPASFGPKARSPSEDSGRASPDEIGE
jgi:hypothetical protein